MKSQAFALASSKLADLIFENPSLVLLLERFGLDLSDIHDANIEQVCLMNGIPLHAFLSLINIQNGHSIPLEQYKLSDVKPIVYYLQQSHQYYTGEKYPEIRSYICQLYANNDASFIKLIEKFFDDYFHEVAEHLEYEDKIAFPYFNALLDETKEEPIKDRSYSVVEYRKHHTDIESKLNELRNLFIRHIPLRGDKAIRRRLLLSLFELEQDLSTHSMIEDSILIPLIERIERNLRNGGR